MDDAGTIIKEGIFQNKLCNSGTITLREDHVHVYCLRGSTTFQFTLTEITRFGLTEQGFYIDEFNFRVDNPKEWMTAICEALNAKDIQFQPTGYRIVNS